MFDYTLRNCTVFVYVELKPLYLVTLLRIDNVVKRTAGQGGNHLDDIVFLCTTGKYYLAFGIAKFAYNVVRIRELDNCSKLALLTQCCRRDIKRNIHFRPEHWMRFRS